MTEGGGGSDGVANGGGGRDRTGCVGVAGSGTGGEVRGGSEFVGGDATT